VLGWTDPEVCGDRTAIELFAGAVMDLHETVTTAAARAPRQSR
jgi:hypothetical protein